MRVKDLKKLLEEKFQDDDIILMDEYNDEGNEYYEIEESRIQLYIFDSKEEEDYNYNSEKFKEGTRALLISQYY